MYVDHSTPTIPKVTCSTCSTTKVVELGTLWEEGLKVTEIVPCFRRGLNDQYFRPLNVGQVPRVEEKRCFFASRERRGPLQSLFSERRWGLVLGSPTGDLKGLIHFHQGCTKTSTPVHRGWGADFRPLEPGPMGGL